MDYTTRKVAEEMPSIKKEEEILVGDEWVRYEQINLDEDDMEVRVDHFWNKMFRRSDGSGDRFELIPKMVKCALALCHSNADVERSLCQQEDANKAKCGYERSNINRVEGDKRCYKKCWWHHKN